MTRRGITLVELLVAIAIIGLLAGLIIPAVQHARATARKMECSNNLRQLALAVANYEAEYRVFPHGATHKLAVLPYLDRRTVAGVNPAMLSGNDPLWADVARTVIPVYVCPLRPRAEMQGLQAASNYAACYGSGLLVGGFDGVFGYWDGMYSWPSHPIGHADLVDGASNVVGFSEWLHSDGTLSRLRVRWTMPQAFTPSDVDAFRCMCQSIPLIPTQFSWQGVAGNRGVEWFNGGLGIGQYNHMLPPNRPSCNNYQNLPMGIHTAGSFHDDGVNAAFMDGHVSFVSETIEGRVWQQLGSRNDGVAVLGM